MNGQIQIDYIWSETHDFKIFLSTSAIFVAYFPQLILRNNPHKYKTCEFRKMKLRRKAQNTEYRKKCTMLRADQKLLLWNPQVGQLQEGGYIKCFYVSECSTSFKFFDVKNHFFEFFGAEGVGVYLTRFLRNSSCSP